MPIDTRNEGKAIDTQRDEAQAYLQSIVDTVREPLLVLDAALRVVSASRSFYTTFRVTPKETEGSLVYELGSGQWDIPEFRRLLEDVLPSSSTFDDFEVTHDFPRIGHRVMLLNARTLYRPGHAQHDAGNHTEMLLLAMEDVTERRAAEARLREVDERYRLLVEGARGHAIVMLDRQGRIAHWNPGAEAIMGWREQEVVGQPGAIFFTPEDRAAGRTEEEMAAAEAVGRAEDQRWHLRKDGTRFFADGLITALRDEQGSLRGFGKVLRDATDQKRAQEVLQAAHEELRVAYERERAIAQALQRPLTLEVTEDAFPGVAVATLYEAALSEAQVGGDFFDAFALPRGRVAFVLADASGKGLSAAVRAMQVKDVVRAFTREYPHSPAAIVSRLNDYVCDTRRFGDYGGESFVCLTLAILDPATGEGAVVTAGCEPPLLLRADGSPDVVEASGLPLGVEREELYPATSLRLAAGDTLVLVTDGITEARRGSEFLGYEGMVELARDARGAATLREMGRAIMEGAKAFGGGALRDDACAVLAKVH